MNLVLSTDLAAHLGTMVANDARLARALADQFLGALDPQVAANYLLTEEVATALLTKRIVADPERTVRDLTALAEGKPAGHGGQRATGRPGRKPRTKPAIAKKSSQPRSKSAKKSSQPSLSTKPAKKISSRRRKPLSVAQAEQLRERVRKLLTKRPWSSRKQLSAGIRFPSEAIYTRIMGELKSEGDVVQRGERSKTVYALRERSRT